MKPPCEIVVSKILPAIRASLAKTLVERGMQQKEVAEMLGITQPAVSQYLSAARGADQRLLQTFPEINRYAEEMAEKVIGGERREMYITYLCKICRRIRTDKKFCDLYKQLANLEECGICYEEDSQC